MGLPADGHVHSEWSWDALNGSMERTCARAVEIGLPALAFTEHVDLTSWIVAAGDFADAMQHLIAPDGLLTPPKFDVDGYLESVQRCRDKFPELRLLTGVEFGQPHWHGAVAAEFIAAGQFERVLGSLHMLPIGEQYFEPVELYKRRRPADVLRDYLTEIPRLVTGSDAFAVLAHIDYAVRYWPGPFDPRDFEDEFRYALGALADSGRALEVNTALPLDPAILQWWRDEGGEAITFGSDAHQPLVLARGFTEATAVVEAAGFRPGRHPYDYWTRS